MKKLVALAFILGFGAAIASDYPRVDEDLKAHDQHIALLQQEFARKPPAPGDEAPETLDARRAQIGLEPMAEYKKRFAAVCHEPTEDSIRRATEAASKK